METKKRWIYALKDPRDDTYKYVGMSKNPSKRLKEHISDSKRERTLRIVTGKPYIHINI